MRHTPDPESQEVATTENVEARLRQEIADLKRQLANQNGSSHAAHPVPGAHSVTPGGAWRPSTLALWTIFLGVIALIVAAFFAGYIPLQKRNAIIRAEARQEEQALPPRGGAYRSARDGH
jgi:hypothetical protein